MSVLTHFPKSRLSELAGRFGGLKREDAVAAAAQALEVLRPEADKKLLEAVEQLESMVSAAIQKRDGSIAMMNTLLPLCDQIVTLAGTYGYTVLDKASRSLCDLLDGLIGQEKADLASIRVHVQTIRMFVPGARTFAPEHIEILLFELHKLLDHHGFVPVADGQDGD